MLRPDPRTTPPTAQTGERGASSEGVVARGNRSDGETDWLQLAQDAFQSSTTYVDSNLRKSWEDSIRAFNNQHPSDSKYAAPQYDKRSKIFRPKTRAIIRKNEAAAAAAFFSNMDVVAIAAQDQTSRAQADSASVMKELLQYRLTKSVPWFQVVLGGLQDAQTVGAVIAHIYWEYEEEPGALSVEAGETASGSTSEEYPTQTQLPKGALQATESGGLEGNPASPFEAITAAPPKIRKDRPCVDLIPIENFRIHPAASWTDPVNTSPYNIHLIPTYVGEVREKMESGEWITYSNARIMSAAQFSSDSTRAARTKGRDDPANADELIDDYAVVWVQRHIHRREGRDWIFYTLGDLELLTEPEYLEDVFLHGIRPYVMGCCILETHKVYPSSVAQLGKGLQDESNEIANQRLDNVKFVLNKKWFVRRGQEADIASLIRNVPGAVIMLNDVEKDVKEVTWPDVTASAFEEQRGIDLAMDDLLGNFNPAAIMMGGAAQGNAPARNMSMLANSNGTLVEYLIRTYVESFVQPVLRQMIQLEQAYETDQVVIAIAAKKAKVYQHYDVDAITDNLLRAELTLSVNVGMGATDPMQKLQKFLYGITLYTNMLLKPVPGIDMIEIGKEVFGLLGYADGSRFFVSDNPQVQVLQQQLQALGAALKVAEQKIAEKNTGHQVKLVTSREKNVADLQKASLHEVNENKRAAATHWRALTEAAMGHHADATKADAERMLSSGQ